MPIPLPNLDDRTYAELTAEAQALIPGLFPEWTNHNPSDPGIVLIELLAWLTEMTLFQLNEIPPNNIETFLGLLGWPLPEDQPEPKDQKDQKPVALDVAVRKTLLALRQQYRAVTAADFERLTLEQWPQTEAAQALGDAAKIKRVRCVPRRNLAAPDPAVRDTAAPAHVSVVVLPDAQDPYAGAPALLLQGLQDFFEKRCLLTTRHHIVGPSFVPVEVSAQLFLREDAPPEKTLDVVIEALYAFFDPLHGGPERNGWPFGRDVYASEIYAIFEGIDLVEYVDEVNLKVPQTEAGRVQKDGDVTVGISLDAHELVAIKVTDLVAIDANGRRYAPEIAGIIGYMPLG